MVDANPNPGQPPAGQSGGSGAPSGGTGKDAELLQRVNSLEESLKKQTAAYDELREVHSRTEALLQSVASNGGKGGSGGGNGGGSSGPRLSKDFATLYNIPNEAAEALVEEAAIRAREERSATERMLAQQANLQKQFYEKNKDLEAHRPVVAYFANEVQGQHPEMTVAQAFEEVAKRTRNYVTKNLTPGGNSEPPPVLPGGQPNPPPSPAPKNGDDKILTPEEELRADIEERRKAMSRGIPTN